MIATFDFLPLIITLVSMSQESSARERRERAKKSEMDPDIFYVSVFFLNFKTINGKSNKAKIMIGLKKKTKGEHDRLSFRAIFQELRTGKKERVNHFPLAMFA